MVPFITAALSLLQGQQNNEAAKKQAMLNAQQQQAALGSMPSGASGYQTQPSQAQQPSILGQLPGLLGSLHKEPDKEPDQDADDTANSPFFRSQQYAKALEDEESR